MANYCPTDSLLKKEQTKIEKQIVDFEEGVWGHRKTPKDSAQAVADSIAALQKVTKKKSNTPKSTRSRRRTSASAESSEKSSSADAQPRVSARRARR